VHDLSQVLWIGGPSASGKSTVARRVARRNGLRWYSCDTRTWVLRLRDRGYDPHDIGNALRTGREIGQQVAERVVCTSRLRRP
jgi:cytidylate kinase